MECFLVTLLCSLLTLNRDWCAVTVTILILYNILIFETYQVKRLVLCSCCP